MAANVGKAAPDALVEATRTACKILRLPAAPSTDEPSGERIRPYFLSNQESLNDTGRLNAWENRNKGVTVMAVSDR
jgi:hypothetical protein